ncbi:MAG: DUF2461 family protein, partial [Proteobacteria bacterium]|nr:DUF2461 family protein [Pseudomonadota bacterium]
MTTQNSFSPSLFNFLRDLAANNDREWFAANKARYVDDVRDPMLEFIAAFGPHLHKISTRYVADPRGNGGSLFRIHRDVRFSESLARNMLLFSLAFAESNARRGPRGDA